MYSGTAALAAGLALGLMTAAVLLVNNFRDVEADARVGRRTLAIVAGPQGTGLIFAALMLLPYMQFPVIGRALPHGHAWPALITLPLTLALIYRFMHEPPGRGLTPRRIFIPAWTG